MRNEDFRDHVRVVFEELRILLEIFGDGRLCPFAVLALSIFRFQYARAYGAGASHSPSNTVVASTCHHAPDVPSPSQPIVSLPPRVITLHCRIEAARGRMPATTAAHAPVPHASVSPAPRSHTRRRMVARSTTCHVAGVHAVAESAGGSRSAGPRVATGAASTSSTTCTACGLPIDSAEIDDRPAADVERLLESAPSRRSNGISSRRESAARPCRR